MNDYDNKFLAETVFDSWMESKNTQNAHNSERIDPVKSRSYAWIWSHWVKHMMHLHPHATSLSAVKSATAADVIHFINSIKSIKSGRPSSDVTRRRYFTLISRIYSFMCAQGIVESNPVDDVHINDLPKPEVSIGSILSPAAWKACMVHLRQPISEPIEFRDRAILRLLFDHGLTPQEIRSLTLKNVTTDMSGNVHIHIEPIRSTYQERMVICTKTATAAITAWLANRDALKPAVALAHTHGLDAPVFLSRRSSSLSMLTLLGICKDHIATSCSRFKVEVPNRLGPQIIRNTRIALWLNEGFDTSAVVKLSGLKNGKGLIHLKHVLSDKTRELVERLDTHD